MRRLRETEGVPFQLDPADAYLLRAADRRLRATLRPRLAFLSEDAGGFTLQNVVGAIRLSDGVLLEVCPKVPAAADWTAAVLDLLSASDRIDISGERLAGLAPTRRDLLAVLATLYERRLAAALRQDGPILLLERHDAVLQRMKGKLRATKYVRNFPLRVHRFPVSYDVFTADNAFSRGMATVALLLAQVAPSNAVRMSLMRSAAGLRPGCPAAVAMDASVARRVLPSQWNAYRPAWSIAAAVLMRALPLGPRGMRHGLEVAIEAWPLLERLLERSLRAAERLGAQAGQPFQFAPKQSRRLLDQPSRSWAKRRHIEPDGLLLHASQPIATFEAKYSSGPRPKNWPQREHIFQALTTAAVFDAPVAVLVYPSKFETCWWQVEGFGGKPQNLVVMGLDLFSYHRGAGDDLRGRSILEIFGPSGPAPVP